MSDPNRVLNEVPALLEERRKYEAWLAALEARRESTPQHVFDRVRGDYESRMRQVEERLSAHRHSIQEERASLVSRRSLLEAEEQLRGDERAELELRAHVGELAGDDSESSFRAVDEALEHMRTEKENLSRRIAELEALLENRIPESMQEPGSVSVAAASEIDAAAWEERPARTTAAISRPTPAATAAPTVSSAVSSAPVPPEASALDRSSGSDVPAPRTPSGSFDELAFLSGVVGQKSQPPAERQVPPTIIREDPASNSLLDGIGSGRGAEPPLAANIPANTPISLRPSAATEQSKTLKCNECGAMNYPTEWYCERCGAELAAL